MDNRKKEQQRTVDKALRQSLWRLYRRRPVPEPWSKGGNLPWDDPAFSTRMLAEHLDETHGAASRPAAERAAQLEWLWQELQLQAGARVLDVTCGPGLYAVPLAERGCQVTGIDFSPAAIRHARDRATLRQVAERCTFLHQDVREMKLAEQAFDAALILYGQLAVFPKRTALALLKTIGQTLRPGGRLLVELLDYEKVDKKAGTWWFSDDRGLWGEQPFLHLGERFWLAEESLAIERFSILHLTSGEMEEIILCDQAYRPAEFQALLNAAGFGPAAVHPGWSGLPLSGGDAWMVYLAQRQPAS
ncbi:MAG: methyltransferase domain-containing protein [Candidatus Promineifilaceae bacterium]|nr:methyltransferase domain-containing protein [Candidatus Promineifilaceae bacterium]